MKRNRAVYLILNPQTGLYLDGFNTEWEWTPSKKTAWCFAAKAEADRRCGVLRKTFPNAVVVQN